MLAIAALPLLAAQALAAEEIMIWPNGAPG